MAANANDTPAVNANPTPATNADEEDRLSFEKATWYLQPRKGYPRFTLYPEPAIRLDYPVGKEPKARTKLTAIVTIYEQKNGEPGVFEPYKAEDDTWMKRNLEYTANVLTLPNNNSLNRMVYFVLSGIKITGNNDFQMAAKYYLEAEFRCESDDPDSVWVREYHGKKMERSNEFEMFREPELHLYADRVRAENVVTSKCCTATNIILCSVQLLDHLANQLLSLLREDYTHARYWNAEKYIREGKSMLFEDVRAPPPQPPTVQQTPPPPPPPQGGKGKTSRGR